MKLITIVTRIKVSTFVHVGVLRIKYATMMAQSCKKVVVNKLIAEKMMKKGDLETLILCSET